MSDKQTEVTPVELALGLLELPSPDHLTEEQVRGVTCLWDSEEEPLTEEAAVALGERSKGHPRGCPKHVAGAAYEALFMHCLGDCEVCSKDEQTVVDGVVQETPCEIAVTLRRLVLRKGRL
ncbi:hypothetical protein ACFY78_39810 [Streptomyces olindensis]|uniref:hypothetical protein n=1 Tax=Streptomyces olindensis TaxID=358823 RepID=UPI0036C85150